MRSRSPVHHGGAPATLAVALLALLALSSCSSGGDDGSGKPAAEATTPKGFTRVESGPVSYAMPKGWERDKDVSEGWTRYIGTHSSEPDVAAAEVSDYQTRFPDDADAKEAATAVGESYQPDEKAQVEDASAPDMPGTTEAYRIDYSHEFREPEFTTYRIADIGLRAEDGTLAVVRVGAVQEMVDDGTFDKLVKSVRMDAG